MISYFLVNIYKEKRILLMIDDSCFLNVTLEWINILCQTTDN